MRSIYARKRPLIAAVAVTALLGTFGALSPALGAGRPAAVLPTLSTSTSFDITGFIESATVTDPADAHSGGRLVVNGQTIVIPRETVVILPASALTWQELFANAPNPYGGTQSGLAMNDSPRPLTTYEVHVIGNRVFDPDTVNGCTTATGCDRMIAGLVNISQQDLNSGTGYINYIDYNTGEIEVGGKLGVQGTGARVRINDPAAPGSGSGGRYGRATSPDTRFQVDQDNPTILAETGFPMCIPRSNPNGQTPDALCPERNRPTVSSPVTDQSGITPNPNALVAGEHYRIFRMDSPANVDGNPANCLRQPCADPRKQAPFEMGDYVTFAGSMVADGAGGTYISAHTITASLGIYTQPGVDPAYVSVDVSLIGTGGLTVFGAGEAAARTRFEGMSTDETRMIRLYGVDMDPATGNTTDREWGTILPDLGPPTGAVRGRWRFRPPCTATTATQKACTPPAGGAFLPPPREVRAVIDGLSQFNPGTKTPNPNSQVPTTSGAKTTANGIYWGQYHAPIQEYIFPENIPGSAVPENNFDTIPFLANGGYTSISGVVAGVLKPWPSASVPNAPVCATPTIVGGPYSVASGSSLQLAGSVNTNATSPVSVNWTAGTAVGGTDLNTALTGATTTTPTFNAAQVPAGTYNLTFTATNVCGTAKDQTTIVVGAATAAPVINPIQAVTGTAGTQVVLTASSNSLPNPTWTWAQTGGPTGLTVTQSPAIGSPGATSSLTFTPQAAGNYTFTVQATNLGGTSLVTIPVTVGAAVGPTTVSVTSAEYRISKTRLIINATSTDPTVTSMKLKPYVTEDGTTFDPAALGANLTVSLVTPGTFTLTLVGAPKPACNQGGNYATPCSKSPIVVTSLTGATVTGTSAPTALTRIRTN